MRITLWLFVLLCCGHSVLAGCGRITTKIEYISYLRNTDDAKGPYAVQVVITSDFQPLKVSLVYSTDEWLTKTTIPMTKNDDTLYKGHIPGQTAGTTIRYYVSVEDSDGKMITDPELATQTVKANSEASSYRFQIQATP